MSNLNSGSKKQKPGPTIPRGHSLAEFRTHAEASDYVNKLVQADFPANKISIIGHDLVLVERVRSRLGYGRVAGSGAVTGFWLGLIFALILGAGVEVGDDGSISYLPQEFMAVVLIAAGGGMLFNILRFVATKNRRGFLSSQMPVAARYEVIVPEEDAVAAHSALSSAGTAK